MTFLSDLHFIFIFWLFSFLLQILSIPVNFLLFRNFFDKGWGLLKITSILFVSYVVFLLSSFKILPFDRGTIFLSVSVFAFLNLYIFLKNKTSIKLSIINNWKIFVFQEILFVSALCFWSFVRGHQPDIEGLEKFMDFGFINSTIKGKWLPPMDIWFSGKSINYYWYGHFITGFIIKASGVPSTVGYNIMIAFIFALCMNAAFSLISSLAKTIGLKSKSIFFAGFISAILLVFGGNFHTPIYSIIEGSDKYWYPDATRFIGYNPDVADKTIHEFPQYSFVVSDLHAHLLNLPYVIFFVSLLWNFFVRKSNKGGLYYALLLGFVLGIMFMTNAWDYANYGILTAICFGFNFLTDKISWKKIVKLITTGLLIIAVSLLTALPFLAGFEQIAEGVKATHSHTPLWQLGVLWGFPAIFSLSFLLFFILKIRKKYLSSDVFILSMLTAAWFLIIIPEFFYIQDIYISSHYRANTMFKLTYQAFVMFYLSVGYIAIRCIELTGKFLQRLSLSLFFCILFGLVLIYPKYSISSYYGSLKIYKGLDGSQWLNLKYPDLYRTIEWLKKNSDQNTILLEAPGDSYTMYNVVSSYSGIPTVSGWFVHEWLWRGEARFPQERVNDIGIIYTSNNIEQTRNLIKKYKINYIIVGNFEREKYPSLNENKFLLIGKIVFSSGKTKVFEVVL